MRKLLFIVLALAGCLLFTEQGRAVPVVRHAATAVLSAGGMQTDVWQCERAYNSDLNQPQALRAAETCPAVHLSQRGGPVPAQRAVVRSVASCGCGTGVVKLISVLLSSNLSVGTHAVDYYVYRLRRLLI